MNITIEKNGILEYGDVTQLQDMFVSFEEQNGKSLPNKDPFGPASAQLVQPKAVLPHDFEPTICSVVNNEAQLRKFLSSTAESSKDEAGPKGCSSPKARIERAR